jgi:hypothetical protein
MPHLIILKSIYGGKGKGIDNATCAGKDAKKTPPEARKPASDAALYDYFWK